jgi:hypothetical protein
MARQFGDMDEATTLVRGLLDKHFRDSNYNRERQRLEAARREAVIARMREYQSATPERRVELDRQFETARDALLSFYRRDGVTR